MFLTSLWSVFQVVDWLCLVLDSHMTQFVLSPDSHVTLINLHCVVSSQVIISQFWFFRGRSRISGKGVRMYRGMGVRCADFISIYPRKLCLWWVYCFHVVCASVCASVPNVLFPKYLKESLLDFHQTLQTCSYMQDKYFR